MATHSQFTPAAGAVFPVSSLPQTVTLPAADAGNLAVVLSNQGPGVVAIVAGSTSGPVFSAPGAITLQAGQTVLASNPGLSMGTLATVQAQGGTGASVTFTRGTLSNIWVFPSATAVF